MLDACVLLVWTRHGILVRRVGGNHDGDLLGDDLADLVLVLPWDGGEQVVETLDDLAEALHLCFRSTAGTINGYGPNLRITVHQFDADRCLHLTAVAVQVDGSKEFSGVILVDR